MPPPSAADALVFVQGGAEGSSAPVASITVDFELSITLHERGWRTA